jgi:hypothetical protein
VRKDDTNRRFRVDSGTSCPRSLQDRRFKGGVEEHVGFIGRILCLKEIIEFRVGRAPLTEYRYPFCRRISEILSKNALSVVVRDYA